MKCTRVEKFLPLYVAGDLASARRERAVEYHLAACEQCRRAAAEHRASRELFRAATLSPAFDKAFYEELRNSVLAQISRRNRTLAPPTRSFSRLFNARLAYAASLALLLIVAALAFNSYTRRAPEGDARRETLAGASHERPAATPQSSTGTPTRSDARTATRPLNEHARVTTNKERRAATSSLPKQDGNIESAQNGSPPRLHTTSRAPLTARRNSRAAAGVATTTRGGGGVAEIAATGGSEGETATSHDVSRIEIQTSDPNIRIIWLSPRGEDAARPLK